LLTTDRFGFGSLHPKESDALTKPTNTSDLLFDRLVDHHGPLFSEDLGLDLTQNTPSALFRWLCAALLMSARISHETAIKAASALSEAGWTTPDRMTQSCWEDRVKVLDDAGYARFDERTARMLGDTARLLCDDYDGDLRNLRSRSDRDPQSERKALKDLKGIGDVGADIFFREVQTVWSEHFPFMDETARKAARRLQIPDCAETLAEQVGPSRFPRIVAALVRAELNGTERKHLLEDQERASP
jgi:endonuclease III